MTAYIVRIEFLPLRWLLWTLWFPVVALELAATLAILCIARVACGIAHVAYQLVVMYLAGMVGSRRRK